MTPKIGTPSFTKAMFTVNSPFLFTNSFVPSKGSTIQHFVQCFLISNEISSFSSEIIGISVCFKSLLIQSLALLSASVIGELSAFLETSNSC